MTALLDHILRGVREQVAPALTEGPIHKIEVHVHRHAPHAPAKLDPEGGDFEPSRLFHGEEGEPESYAHQSLASMYARLWNTLELLGQEVPEGELHQASEELGHGDWCVYREEDRPWQVKHTDDPAVQDALRQRALAVLRQDEDGEDDGFQLAAIRATGYTKTHPLVIGGKRYWGGMWIPSKVADKLTDEEKQHLAAAQAKNKPAAEAEQAKRQARLAQHGTVTPEHLEQHLAEHARPLNKQEQVQAGRQFRALHGHHGHLVLHRLKELAGQIQGWLDHPNTAPKGAGADQLRGALARIHHMIGLARAKGVTGEVQPGVSSSTAQFAQLKPATKETKQKAGEKEAAPSSPSIREAQDAAAQLGDKATEEIVGPGGLSGASPASLQRLTAESQRQKKNSASESEPSAKQKPAKAAEPPAPKATQAPKAEQLIQPALNALRVHQSDANLQAVARAYVAAGLPMEDYGPAVRGIYKEVGAKINLPKVNETFRQEKRQLEEAPKENTPPESPDPAEAPGAGDDHMKAVADLLDDDEQGPATEDTERNVADAARHLEEEDKGWQGEKTGATRPFADLSKDELVARLKFVQQRLKVADPKKDRLHWQALNHQRELLESEQDQRAEEIPPSPKKKAREAMREKPAPKQTSPPVAPVDRQAVLRDALAANKADPRTATTPYIPDLYDAIKGKHPGLTEPEFHQILKDAAQKGDITLQAFNAAGNVNLASTGHKAERFPTHPRHSGPAGWIAASQEPPAPASAARASQKDVDALTSRLKEIRGSYAHTGYAIPMTEVRKELRKKGYTDPEQQNAIIQKARDLGLVSGQSIEGRGTTQAQRDARLPDRDTPAGIGSLVVRDQAEHGQQPIAPTVTSLAGDRLKALYDRALSDPHALVPSVVDREMANLPEDVPSLQDIARHLEVRQPKASKKGLREQIRNKLLEPHHIRESIQV